MKPIFTRLVFFLSLTVLHQAATAQTYTVTTNGESWATLTGANANNCNTCIINIPAGWTLLLNSAGTCNGCTFTGGTVNISHSFSFTNNTTNFNSDTVLIGVATTFNSVDFSSDSIAVNAALTSNNNTTTISNSRIAANAALKFNELTLTNDSLHLNANLTISNATDNFTGDNIDVANGVTISSQGATYTNSVLSFAGSSKLTISNSMVSDASTFYMAGTSSIKASSITTSGGAIDETDTAKITSSNNISFTGTAVSMDSSSTMAASGSATFQTGATLVMNNKASLTITNSLTVSASDVYLYGNSVLTDNPATIESNSYFQIGDGTDSSHAHLTSDNTLTVDASSNLAIANHNNYFKTNVSSYTGGGTSYSIAGNNISCGGGGTENACASDVVYGCGTLNGGGAVGCVTLALADIVLTAVPASASAVNLSWSDGQSATADHYLVQRSTDNGDWTSLATIAAGGYTAGDYQFEDPAAPAGTDNYRIARVDQDGAVLYSAVSSVTIAGAAGTAGAISIYPNPVTGHTFFIRVPDTEQLTLSVFTVTGQLLLRQSLVGQTQYQVLLPSQLLPGNTVIVQTIGPTAKQAFPLLLQ